MNRLKYWVRRQMYLLGRWLVCTNYSANDQNHVVQHDMALRIQEMNSEISRLKLKLLVNRAKGMT